MKEQNLSEEILNPQTTLILEDIARKLSPHEEEKGIIGENGRLNIEGRELANGVYGEFLKRVGGDYRKMLNICKEAESLLYVGDAESNDTEILRVLRSIRGKTVYHAHKTWVEENLPEDNQSGASASNIMKRAKTLKLERGNEIDIYEEATRIESEKKRLDDDLSERSLHLERINEQLLTEDIKKLPDLDENVRESLLRKLQNKLEKFATKILPPTTRGKIVAGAVATVAVTSVVLGYISHLNSGKKARLEASPKNNVATLAVPNIAESYHDNFTEPYLSNTDEEIPRFVTSPPIIIEAPAISDKARKTETNHAVLNAINIVFEQERFRGVLQYEKNFVPDNLVNLSEYNINILGNEVQIREEVVRPLLGFINEAEEMGYTIGVAYGYRSYDFQDELYNYNPDGAAEAGQSQHQSGYAVDLYWLMDGTWNKQKNLPPELLALAEKWGFARPLAWDSPHFVVLGAISPEALDAFREAGLEMIPGDPTDYRTNFAINDLLQALQQQQEVGPQTAGN